MGFKRTPFFYLLMFSMLSNENIDVLYNSGTTKFYKKMTIGVSKTFFWRKK